MNDGLSRRAFLVGASALGAGRALPSTGFPAAATGLDSAKPLSGSRVANAFVGAKKQKADIMRPFANRRRGLLASVRPRAANSLTPSKSSATQSTKISKDILKSRHQRSPHRLTEVCRKPANEVARCAIGRRPLSLARVASAPKRIPWDEAAATSFTAIARYPFHVTSSVHSGRTAADSTPLACSRRTCRTAAARVSVG